MPTTICRSDQVPDNGKTIVVAHTKKLAREYAKKHSLPENSWIYCGRDGVAFRGRTHPKVILCETWMARPDIGEVRRAASGAGIRIMEFSDKLETRLMTDNSTQITIPVLDSFGNNQVIGHLVIDASKLPPTPEFTFVLGYEANRQTLGLGIGDIPTEPHKGPYRLMSIAPVMDTEYAKYLAQVGVIQSDVGEDRSARG